VYLVEFALDERSVNALCPPESFTVSPGLQLGPLHGVPWAGEGQNLVTFLRCSSPWDWAGP